MCFVIGGDCAVDKILNFFKILYDAKEKTTDKYNEINNKIDEKYSEDVEKATKVKKYFKGAISVLALLIIYSVISIFRSDNLEITPEQFQKIYNDNFIKYLKNEKYVTNLDNENIEGIYEHFKIKSIKYYSEDKSKIALFETNENQIMIKSTISDNDKYLDNVSIYCLEPRENWKVFCSLALIIAHSFNNKSNIDETNDIIQKVREKFADGNFVSSITIDGFSYSIQPTTNGSSLMMSFNISKVTNNDKYAKNESDSNTNLKVNQQNQTKPESKIEKPKENQSNTPPTTEKLQDNQSKQNTSKKVDNEQNKEKAQGMKLLLGKSEITGRTCYLLYDSIHINGDKSVNCKIEMVKSKNDVKYLEYRFYGDNLMKFTTNEGFDGAVSEKETPIEYNIMRALQNRVK